MNRIAIVCLTTLSLLASARPAEAGRRVRRAARATTIVAAATGGAAVVAARPRRTTVVVAAAPRRTAVVAAAPVPTALPDLTIVDVVAQHGDLCITVKNVGQVTSPETRLQINLVQPASQAFVAGRTVRVRPLGVNQSVKIRLRSAPVGDLESLVRVDPDQLVAELDETNNDLSVAFAVPAPEQLPVLEEEVAWGAARVMAD